MASTTETTGRLPLTYPGVGFIFPYKLSTKDAFRWERCSDKSVFTKSILRVQSLVLPSTDKCMPFNALYLHTSGTRRRFLHHSFPSFLSCFLFL